MLVRRKLPTARVVGKLLPPCPRYGCGTVTVRRPFLTARGITTGGTMGLRNRWNYSGYPYFITTTVVEWAEVFRV
ncbi:MAG: hypothetical protein IPI25_09505 [Candidatus Brocadia sp.]|nr:MAG: hypothetical protein IPI25_09505 [Candidatus Brocadia sp.]